MAKGYWIANVDVLDLQGMQSYRAASGKVLLRHGAKFLVANGRQDIKEGELRPQQIVVEFESYDAALAAFNDPDYQEAAKLRRASASAALVIVEGFEPPETPRA